MLPFLRARFPLKPNVNFHPTSRLITTHRFGAFVPPPPSSLPKPRPPRTYSPRLVKYVRRSSYLAGGILTLYLADRYLNYSTLTRNLRTISTCVIIAADYKINFTQHKNSTQLSRLHERTAERLLYLCLTNGGLYQKIGQAIAMQSAVLPPVFLEKFSKFFDETPQASWGEVEKVLRQEYRSFVGEGRDIVDRVFMPGSFEHRAIGSASVAQVHRARLKSGEVVAVKIQKPWIKRQVKLDLLVFRVVTDLLSTRLFAMPLSFLTPYICEQLLKETDFLNEAQNSEHTREFIASQPSLVDRVYVPKIYHEYSTSRIMVAEWIDGVGVAEREILTGQYRGDNWVGHEVGTPRSVVEREGPRKRIRGTGDGAWDRIRIKKRIYGLGLREKDVMKSMVDLFCAQMFLGGWVHCDPHPGNILIQRLPSGKPLLVLLDHGLYIRTTPEFRHQYALFWKSLLTFDNETIHKISDDWGIGNSDLFASATLLRPYTGGNQEIATIVGGHGKEGSARTAYEANMMLREKMKAFLYDQDRMPKELVFIGRNMRIVQGNNQHLGSPVNRLKIIANWASHSLTILDPADPSRPPPLMKRLKAMWQHIVFKIVVFGLDIGFWGSRARQRLWGGKGFEEALEDRMKKVALEEFGVELQGAVFQG